MTGACLPDFLPFPSLFARGGRIEVGSSASYRSSYSALPGSRLRFERPSPEEEDAGTPLALMLACSTDRMIQIRTRSLFLSIGPTITIRSRYPRVGHQCFSIGLERPKFDHSTVAASTMKHGLGIGHTVHDSLAEEVPLVGNGAIGWAVHDGGCC